MTKIKAFKSIPNSRLRSNRDTMFMDKRVTPPARELRPRIPGTLHLHGTQGYPHRKAIHA